MTRRDTAANWVAANTVVPMAEAAVESDTGKQKIGDGATSWNDLPYAPSRTAASTLASGDVYTPADVTGLNAALNAATASGGTSGYDVFPLLGQSNMVGYSGQPASSSLDPAVSQIYQLKQDGTIVPAAEFLDQITTPTGVGPGFPFARNYVKQGLNRGRKVLLVPCAQVSTKLVGTGTPTWNSTVTGSLLDAAIARIGTAVASEAGSVVRAFLWLQGGADAINGETQANYAAALDALITKLRAQAWGSNVPFILSSDPPEVDNSYPNMANIRAALVDTPNRNSKCAYVSPPTNSVVAGNLHYTNTGQRTMGRKMFDAYQGVRAGIFEDTTLGLSNLSPVFPPNMHQSGRYFVCNSVATTANTAPTLNELRAYAWPVFTSLPLGGLFAQFTAAGSADSILRLGIYADDGTGVPGSLVMDLGSISTGTGNAGTVATGGTPGVYLVPVPSAITLPPGLYWVCAVAQGTTAATCALTGASTQAYYQYHTPQSAGVASFTAAMGFRQSSVSGALPSTFALVGASATPVRIGYKVA